MINMVSELSSANIKVFGVGGGGGNTINCLHRKNIQGVELFLLNTDKQVMSASRVKNKIGIGQTLTKGLGAGANPQIGKEAALESEEDIRSLIKGTDLLFLAVGMGGGTGTGASPEIGRIAREEGVLTVAVTTLPFIFEGRKRMNTAKAGVEALKDIVDTSIVLENQKILPLISKTATMPESFETVDDILCQAVISVTDLITKPGLINLDFADLKTVLEGGGSAFMVTGTASGSERSEKAAKAAVNSPLMTRSSLVGAQKLIINISGSSSMTLDEVNEAASIIHSKADEDCHNIVGTVIDESLGDELRVTIVATDFNDELREEPRAVSSDTLKVLSLNIPEREEPRQYMNIPSTVLTQYESTNGRKRTFRETNIDYPTFLRARKA